jgi:hypothetical protein
MYSHRRKLLDILNVSLDGKLAASHDEREADFSVQFFPHVDLAQLK